MCSMTLCYSAPTTYRGYDKRDAIRGAIPENWQIIPEAEFERSYRAKDRARYENETSRSKAVSKACIDDLSFETVFVFPFSFFERIYDNCTKIGI